MITISGFPVDFHTIANQYAPGSIDWKISYILSSSNYIHVYESFNQLNFELNLRKNIMRAAVEMNDSDFSFESFRDSKCNPDFWERTDEGGFLLRSDVLPSAAVKDIYLNSSKYGTDCSTAILVIYYKALSDTLLPAVFDRMFPKIYLANWHNLDSTLGIVHYRNPADFLPGDCRYFSNPDVDPLTPQWIGENAIDLSNGTFFGHGVGIKTADEMADELNKHRKDGAEISAFLMDSATRPNFKFLANQSYYLSSPVPWG